MKSIELMRKIKAVSVFWATCLAVFGSLVAGAQASENYPSSPVTVVVPYDAGGATDVIARIISEHLSDDLGQPFIVENRPGAGGITGAGGVARAAPDGYTLLMWHAGLVMAPLMHTTTPYSEDSFQPIVMTGRSPNILAVNPDFGAENLAELIDTASGTPGAVRASISGVGGSDHLALELLQALSGVEFLTIPYEGGAPAVLAAAGGEVDIVMMSAGSVLPQINSGGLRPLAVTTDSRYDQLPDVPTIAESGVDGYNVSLWFGLFSPEGTPDAILGKLHNAVAKAISEPEVAERLRNLGIEAVSSASHQQFTQHVREEWSTWSKVAQEASIGPK